MEEASSLLEIYRMLQWLWCCRLQVQELTQRHQQQQTGWCRRRAPETEFTAEKGESDCGKKVTSAVKIQIYTSKPLKQVWVLQSLHFIFIHSISPISGEPLPSSGHCLNSSLCYTKCVATMTWDFASKLQWKLQPGCYKHKGCFLENNSQNWSKLTTQCHPQSLVLLHGFSKRHVMCEHHRPHLAYAINCEVRASLYGEQRGFT